MGDKSTTLRIIREQDGKYKCEVYNNRCGWRTLHYGYSHTFKICAMIEIRRYIRYKRRDRHTIVKEYNVYGIDDR